VSNLFSSEQLTLLFNAYVVPFAVQLILATLVLLVGRIVTRLLVRFAGKLLRRAKVDESLIRFLSSVLYVVLLMVVVIASLEQLGVQTTAAIAVLGAAGLAIGLALQGSLGNFASGVLLIVFKPYTVNDVVNLGGTIGTVLEVGVFNTVLLTGDNREIIIPNGAITSDKIENMTKQETRRIDMVFGIGYDDDLRKAKEILDGLVKADERILAEPAPVIVVGELADSSVNLLCRPWVKTPDYWAVLWDLTEKTKLAFDENGISIPFPQRDVHVHNVAA
jgi:small conductance mechanosensitive channel